MVGEIGRGYLQQDVIEVRFDSKYNGKALMGLRIFQTDCSGCSMGGWEGNRAKWGRQTYLEVILEIQVRDDSSLG